MLRDDFDRLAAGFFGAAGFFAVLLRDAPAVDDFARVGVDFLAVLRFGAARFAAGRFAVDRFAGELRAPLLLLELAAEEPLLVLALPSIDHLPVMTR